MGWTSWRIYRSYKSQRRSPAGPTLYLMLSLSGCDEMFSRIQRYGGLAADGNRGIRGLIRSKRFLEATIRGHLKQKKFNEPQLSTLVRLRVRGSRFLRSPFLLHPFLQSPVLLRVQPRFRFQTFPCRDREPSSVGLWLDPCTTKRPQRCRSWGWRAVQPIIRDCGY